MGDQSNEWTLVVWGAIATVFGVVAVWNSISAWRLAGRARTWPTTNGVITSSEISHEGKYWTPRVKYRYEVDGREFNGTTVSPGGPTGANWKSPAQRVIEKYPSSKRVLVYYDPRKPARACLERKVGFGVVVFFVFGIVFGLLGLGALVSWLLSRFAI